jgi:hypothetical protein
MGNRMRKLVAAFLVLAWGSMADAQTYPGNLNPLTIAQSPSGSFAANTNFNSVTLSDTATITGGFFGNGLNITDNFGGSLVQGGRQTIISTAALNATTSASSTNRNYVGVQGVGQAIANDNGTNPAALGTSAGAMFGGSFIGVLGNSSATSFLNVTGAEFNTRMVTGSSAAVKTLAQFSADVLDRVQGSVVDSMLWLSNQSASNPGWNAGILFDGTNSVWPIKSTGTIFQTIGAGTAAHGVDLSATTFSSDAFKSTGFLVDGSGNLTANNVTTAWTTFTPSLSCGTATFTVNSARFKTFGKTTHISIDFTITAIGTCGASVSFTLPNTSAFSGTVPLIETAVNGVLGMCRESAGSATATCSQNNTTGAPLGNFLVNERFQGSGVYENQ